MERPPPGLAAPVAPGNFFADSEAERQRSTFPLPEGNFRREQRADVSRKVRRQREVQVHIDEWCDEIASSCNCLYLGMPEGNRRFRGARPTLAQQFCLKEIRDSIISCGKPPPDMTGRGPSVSSEQA